MIHNRVGEMVRAAGHPPLATDEGGWGPPLGSDREAIDWVARAIDHEGVDAAIGVDVAATQFFDTTNGTYRLAAMPEPLSSAGLVDVLCEWARDFPILSLEDGLAEDDWDGWARLSASLRSLQLLGDDLFVTSHQRLERGIAAGIANAVLVKPNQVGTLSEALEVIELARRNGYRAVISARSGETEDSFIADLAVGRAAGQIKVGSVTRSSRLAKWNQLLRIEEQLGPDAYVSAGVLRHETRS